MVDSPFVGTNTLVWDVCVWSINANGGRELFCVTKRSRRYLSPVLNQGRKRRRERNFNITIFCSGDIYNSMMTNK